MVDDLPLAMLSHQRIPTPSWEPRCAICRLWRDNRAAYDYCTEALVGGTATQAEIVVALKDRWDVKAGISQLSRHRTRHLMPDLRDAHETWIATEVVLRELGDVTPAELAERLDQATALRLYQRLQDGDLEPKELAGLASSLAKVTSGLREATTLPSTAAEAEERVGLLRLKRALEEGKYEDAVLAFIRERYPHLLPAMTPAAGGAEEGGGEPAEDGAPA